MELQATIDAVHALLRQGDTGAALETLRLFLGDNKKQYPDALRALQGMEANYGATRQQELKGILSFQEAQREYSRINDALLALLDDLSAGRVPASAGSTRRRRAWLMGGAALLFIVALVLWVSRDNQSCPDFDDTQGLHVMLLPFQNVGGAPAKPEKVLQEGIRDLTQKNKLAADVKVLGDYDSERKNPDAKDAASLGRHCSADFVVWGSYSSGDSARVDINYIFPNKEDQGGSTGFQAFKNITDLQSGAMLRRSLDDAILSLCAMMALRANDLPLAKKWLDKVKEPSAQDSAMLSFVNEKQK